MTIQNEGGRILTFYSYKGGTGRSMAVANIAWMLASRGKRVLAVDWDLEAPGLHRYFEPFLTDKLLERSTGVIDFVLDFTNAALERTKEEPIPDWHLRYANIRAHAVPVVWEFPENGALHLVPAGRQDSGYPLRVNAFDWRLFYERLGGGVWLEAVKRQMRENYDYILVDSRTGVSDTSGICTVQVPDDLVVCFTLNNQSMRGASAVGHSALQQRRREDGTATLQVWPLPMRVESAEQERLQVARAFARTRFSGLMGHLSVPQEDDYWANVEIAYTPFYAYEEVLGTFGDRPRMSRTLLAGMETLLSFLAPGMAPGVPMLEDVRAAGLKKFLSHPASDALEDLRLLSAEYLRIRNGMASGDERTYMMTALLARASSITGTEGIAQVAEGLFRTGSDGGRILGLSLASRDPLRIHVDMAISGVGESRSAFEQYYALLLATQLQPLMDPEARQKLREAIQSQINVGNISRRDSSRSNPAMELLKTLSVDSSDGLWSRPREVESADMAGGISCVDIQPPSQQVYFEDPDERHGPWLRSRVNHTLTLPKTYRIGRDLVTNGEYLHFMQAGGYEREEFWPSRFRKRIQFLVSGDGGTLGPASWPHGKLPDDREQYPVSGICYYEALAFVTWLQEEEPVAGWKWTLPREDQWEFAARSEAGLIYPWGDSFDPSKCNSSESDIGGPSYVEQFATGLSRYGCRDMAGNLWEFVLSDYLKEQSCILRGGSFKNDRAELRNYLRLFGVRYEFRAEDFGFRLAQEVVSGG